MEKVSKLAQPDSDSDSHQLSSLSSSKDLPPPDSQKASRQLSDSQKASRQLSDSQKASRRPYDLPGWIGYLD
jgi:hypothetical protein